MWLGDRIDAEPRRPPRIGGCLHDHRGCGTRWTEPRSWATMNERWSVRPRVRLRTSPWEVSTDRNWLLIIRCCPAAPSSGRPGRSAPGPPEGRGHRGPPPPALVGRRPDRFVARRVRRRCGRVTLQLGGRLVHPSPRRWHPDGGIRPRLHRRRVASTDGRLVAAPQPDLRRADGGSEGRGHDLGGRPVAPALQLRDRRPVTPRWHPLEHRHRHEPGHGALVPSRPVAAPEGGPGSGVARHRPGTVRCLPGHLPVRPGGTGTIR